MLKRQDGIEKRRICCAEFQISVGFSAKILELLMLQVGMTLYIFKTCYSVNRVSTGPLKVKTSKKVYNTKLLALTTQAADDDVKLTKINAGLTITVIVYTTWSLVLYHLPGS